MKRAATLVLVMLAMSASAAVEELANLLGLMKRKAIGEFYGLPLPDIEGRAGFERILVSPSQVKAFNKAVRAGLISVRRRKL